VGSDGGLDSVARALGSEDASARLLALEVILGFSADRAAGLLAAAIHDPDRAVQRAAIAAAGRMNAERAVSALILALDTSDSELRADTLRALERITGKTVDPADIEDPEQRADTLEALGNWWKRERVRRLAASYGLDVSVGPQ
jgi:HEAT repeat protein